MTEKVGVIGWPLTYSLSPIMHNAAFKALALDWQYDLMPIPPDILRLGLREPQQHGYIGINVTTPHKEGVLFYVKGDDIARAVGAANTVDFRTDTATNTDVAGLIHDLKAHHIPLEGARVLVLGGRGAARAAVYGLAQEGARITIVNRTLERAQTMLANLMIYQPSMQADVLTLDEAVEQGCDLIINCTTVGLTPEVEATPWVTGVPFPHGVTVYDMIYRPAKTALMRQAEANGGRAINGIGMLVRQGALSFELWTGQPAPVEVMTEAVEQVLAKER